MKKNSLQRLFIVCLTASISVSALQAETIGALDPLEVTPALRNMYDGMMDAQDGDYDAAIPKLEQALAADPTLIGAWETLGWSYWHTGRQDDAETLWEQLRALAPDEPRVYQWLATIAASRRELGKATDLLRRSLRLDPGQYETRLDLLRVHLWRGRLSDAIQLGRELLDEDPDRLDVALELARTLQYAWHYDEALPLWNQLLDVAPDISEYRLGRAQALLHTGQRDDAVAIAREILDDDPRNVLALSILADDAEYSDRPVRAVPFFRRAIAATEDVEDRRALHRRLTTLLVRLYQENPLRYMIDVPIRATRAFLEDDPTNVDAMLILAELLLMDRRFEESESLLYHVLRGYNPNNYRAHRGLYAIAMARFRFEEAWEHLERIRAFNPRDPYLLADEAQYHARRGDFTSAHEALDELERRGGYGAAAVLRYSVITSSEIGPAMPLHRLREHWQALQNAGYRFLTVNELPEFMAMTGQQPERVAGIAPSRAAIITFDGALEPAMTLAGKLAGEMGISLQQFIPVGAVDKEDALVADWERLRRHGRNDTWQYGSLLLDAHDSARVFLADQPRAPLANRIRRDDDNRLETTDEFSDRIRSEYSDSRDLLQDRLARNITVCAYPESDIGQQLASNEPLAPAINLAHAERFYRMGFISRPQGHAVQSDNPFLFGRYEPMPWMTGDEVVEHLTAHHPVFMAQRMRIEFAAFEGRRGLARQTLAQMERSGYPASGIDQLETFIQSHLARKFDLPVVVDDVRKAPWKPQPENPYLAIDGRMFSDSLDSDSRRGRLTGGLHLTPAFTLALQAGAGRHTQPDIRTHAENTDARLPDVAIDERSFSLSAAAMLPRRTVLSASLGRREYSGDADWQLWNLSAGLNIRPVEPIDLKLEYEHDSTPGARAMRRELTQDRAGLHGVWTPNDRFDLWGSAQQYIFSDSNRRTHWHILPMVLLWREPGMVAGFRYAEDDSRSEDRDYWTPYRQQGYHLEAGFRGNWRRQGYSLIGRVGKARERIRPEAEQEYRDLLAVYESLQADARRGRWGRQAIDEIDEILEDVRRNPPESRWETTVGIQATCILRWGEQWEAHGLVAYEESPRYNETHLGAGITYRF